MKHLGVLPCLALLVAASMSQGCVGRAISEGIEKTLGPTAIALPMEPRWPEGDSQYLAEYRNFELAGPINNEFPDTPQAFLNYFPVKFAEQLAGRDLPTDVKGRTLLISVTILGYQPASSYHKALGPTEEVVARVVLTDKERGKVVGSAICIGRTYQSVGLGMKWKAWGLSRAIINKWIDNYYPKQGRREGEEQAPSE
jgi:hypothetical protein